MILLSVDYGDQRTGIAVCDALEMLAHPVTVLRETDAGVLAARIAALVKEHKAEEVVLGLPKNMDGTQGERAEKSRALGRLIEKKSGVPVRFWDERLTTVSAHLALTDNGTFGKKRKNVVDAVAATIILESYLAYRKNQSHA